MKMFTIQTPANLENDLVYTTWVKTNNCWRAEPQPFQYFNEVGTYGQLTLSPGTSSYEAAWMLYAKKQRIAPIQRRIENPPNSCLQNFTHSGIVLGGVSSLRPSLRRYSAAFAFVRPCKYTHKQSVRHLVWHPAPYYIHICQSTIKSYYFFQAGADFWLI